MVELNRIKSLMGLIIEEFDWSHVTKTVAEKYPNEIYQLLLQMFPDQEEIIAYHYNDELGVPFAEWRKKIYDIKDWVLEGPTMISPNKIHMDKEDMLNRQEKYDKYISGESKKYFRDSDADPRDIDFTKVPAVTLEKIETGYTVDDGMHRVFLAKMLNKPLNAYIWVKKQNNSPFVEEIEKLFN